MKLTKSTDYALRLLIHLSANREQATMPELSNRLFISYNHLSKLVQLLAKAGYIQTKQGKFGGVSLLKEPESIHLKEIIHLVDGPIQLSECLKSSDSCSLSCDCKLKEAFSHIQVKIDRLFEEITLDKLI